MAVGIAAAVLSGTVSCSYCVRERVYSVTACRPWNLVTHLVIILNQSVQETWNSSAGKCKLKQLVMIVSNYSSHVAVGMLWSS